MRKKIMAALLALVMMLLPVVGTAELMEDAVANGRKLVRHTTFTVAETGEEDLDALLNDLFSALEVITTLEKGDVEQGSLAVQSNGKDLLTFAFAGKGDDVYVNSNLLGGETFMFSAGDVPAVTEKLLNFMVEFGMIDEDTVAQIKEQMKNAASNAALSSFVALDVANALTEMGQALEEVVAKIMENPEELDPSTQPEGSDPAVSAMRYYLTAEDIATLDNTIIDIARGNTGVMSVLDGMFASEGINSEEALDQIQTLMKEEFPKMLKEPIALDLYLDADGMPVAATYGFTMHAPEGAGDPESIYMNVVFTRQTAEGESIRVAVDFGEDEKPVGAVIVEALLNGNHEEIAVTLDDTQEVYTFRYAGNMDLGETKQTLDAIFEVLANDQQAFAITADIAEEMNANGIDVDKTVVLTLYVEGQNMVTINTVSHSEEPSGTIADDENVKNLGELEGEDFEGWCINVLLSILSWPNTALQALPENVQSFFK